MGWRVLAPSVPRTTVRRVAALVIATATNTAIPFDTTVIDQLGVYNPAVDATKLVIRQPGDYRITISGSWTQSAVGNRIVAVWKNGLGTANDYIVGDVRASASSADANASAVVTLAAGDFLQLAMFQDSAVNQSTGNVAANSNPPTLTLERVG